MTATKACTAGIDVGSTYTKTVLLNADNQILGRSLIKTGFKLAEAAQRSLDEALEAAGLEAGQVSYLATTGYGRFQVPFRNVNVTDLTANARGVHLLFPNTRTILDVGGQTMKASRLDENGKVRSFRLNDKCAAGTGAFLEKTARYMGFGTAEIGPLAATSKQTVAISGVCAVFAESEVINHLSQGSSPADIMHGAIVSLVDRSVHSRRRHLALRVDGARHPPEAGPGRERAGRGHGPVHRGPRRGATGSAPDAEAGRPGRRGRGGRTRPGLKQPASRRREVSHP
jgi:predicted CoA-substrate-specific enzyme activase